MIEFEDIVEDNLNNLVIKIYAIKFEEYPKLIKNNINNLLTIITELIGINTDINYHALDNAVNGYIYINLYNYNEAFNTVDELIEKRLNTLRNYLEHVDFTKQQAHIIKTVNILSHHGVMIDTLFRVSIVNIVNNKTYMEGSPILLKIPVNYDRVIVKRLNINNNKLTIINDKCALNYGLFINLTIPFNEMGMSYNALHLYEHLMMRCFKGLSRNNVVEINGSTYPNGLCFVYVIINNLASFKEYLNNVMKVMLEIRDLEYWTKEEQVKDIKFETKRTISETRTNRSLTDFGRSDLHAYSAEGYDTNIFKYWSNKPFDIIIVGQDISDNIVDTKVIEKYTQKFKINYVERPKNIKYKKIPIDVLRNKEYNMTFVQKVDTDYIKNLFMNCIKNSDINIVSFLSDGLIDYGPYGYLYGLDCKYICLQESLENVNTYISPIVFLNSLFTDTELTDMLNKSNLPINVLHYNTTKYFT